MPVTAMIPEALAKVIPTELQVRPQWVVWRYEERPGDPKPTKVPYQARRHGRASTTFASTWSTFEEVLERAENYDGIGYVFAPDDDIVGIDLDHCRNPKTGFIEDWAVDILGVTRSYTEVSPSGEGLHIFVRGRLPAGARKRGRVEMYERGRYFTVTGRRLDELPAAVREPAVPMAELHAKLMPPAPPQPPVGPAPSSVGTDLDDGALLARALGAANGAKFGALWGGDISGYPSPSEADLGLCMLLAFWTARDSSRIDRLFRQSGLLRPKWDEHHGEETYGARTIRHAIERCQEVYSGRSLCADSSAQVPFSPSQTATAEQVQVEPAPVNGSPPTPFSEEAGALLARSFPPVEVYVESILTAEGSGFIGGEEKLGKTYYALAEALSLALGQPLCGRFAVPARRRVLFIEEEDSPRRTQRRLRALGRGLGFDPDDAAFQADLSAWLRVAVWQGFRLDNGSWLARLDAELDAFPAAIVYLDVLRKITSRDLNKQSEVAPLLEVLDAPRRQRGCIFRVLHHYRKGQGLRMGRGSQEIGGSYVLGAWAEQSVFLEPIGRKGGGTAFDVQLKDAAAAPTLRLRFDAEGPAHDPSWVRLSLDDIQTDAAPGEKHADQVLQLLRTLPPEPSPYGAGVTVKAIAMALKKSDRVARRGLEFLIEKGLCAANGSPSTKLRRYTCTASDEAMNAAQPEAEGLF